MKKEVKKIQHQLCAKHHNNDAKWSANRWVGVGMWNLHYGWVKLVTQVEEWGEKEKKREEKINFFANTAKCAIGMALSG